MPQVVGFATATALSADGQTDGDWQVAPRNGTAGWVNVICRGTFGGGTLTAQMSHDGTNFVDLKKNDLGDDVELTAVGAYTINVGGGGYLRFSLTGSTSPSLVVSISA